MDGNTEPLIAVIGYPIAGNPAQFALQRALEAMGLDWRVLSFEIPPDQLGAALDAVETLRFHGVLVDPGLAELTGKWYAQRHTFAASPQSASSRAAPSRIDCLFRSPLDASANSDSPPSLLAADAQGDWLRARVRRHFDDRGRKPLRGLCVGNVGPPPQLQPASSPQLEGSPQNEGSPPIDVSEETSAGAGGLDALQWEIKREPDPTVAADLILLTPPSDRTLVLEPEDWPMNDASTLVIDLTEEGHPEVGILSLRGYQLLSDDQRRVGTLAQSLRHWTGLDANADVLQDAIEEYLDV